MPFSNHALQQMHEEAPDDSALHQNKQESEYEKKIENMVSNKMKEKHNEKSDIIGSLKRDEDYESETD